MKVAITGASGLIGRALTERLVARGDMVSAVTRDPRRAREDEYSIFWAPERGEIEAHALDGHDAVVHLAGDNIAQGRWDAEKKRGILESRVGPTRLLARTLAGLTRPPRVLVSASAIGYYGSRADGPVDESGPCGDDFLADVCRQWETATVEAERAGIRVVHARIGVTLDARGGAFPTMIRAFRLGLGGVFGDGAQVWSWLTLDDVARAFVFMIDHDAISGPVNVVSPNPVTNREFTRSLGKALNRPTVFPLPASLARVAFGEFANELMLASRNVIPRRLLEQGFEFSDTELEPALRRLVGGRRRT